MNKLEKIRELLEQIRDFGHVEGCTSSAPVCECCYFRSRDQKQIACEALAILDDANDEAIIAAQYEQRQSGDNSWYS